MKKNKTSVIEKITLNKATYHNAACENLNYINFFYGNNGTGKSTISEEITAKNGLVLKSGVNLDDFTIFTFNKDFTTLHFSEDKKIPSIFTIGEGNVANKENTIKFKKENKDISREIDKIADIITEKNKSISALNKAFNNSFWADTSTIRDFFSNNIIGLSKNKDSFIEKTKEKIKLGEYCEDLENIKDLYTTAYSTDNQQKYPFMESLNFIVDDKSELLQTSIVTSDSTEFARFVKIMNSSAWLQHGHDKLTKSNKCPYCQQTLPADFEENYKSCFNAEYEKNISDISHYLETYSIAYQKIVETHEFNIEIEKLNTDINSYISEFEKLESTIRKNIELLQKKLADPSIKITLESSEAKLKAVNQIIKDFNEKTKKNNDIIENIKESQKKCEKMVWAYFAFLLKPKLEIHDTSINEVKEDIKKQTDSQQELILKKEANEKAIIEMAAEKVSAEPAVKAINLLLKTSGFQGFHLEWKESEKDKYQVVYDTKDASDNYIPAKKLSEGERNFISFLYFYHLIGSPDELGNKKKSIVVIDDPVSSMDGQALYIVSSLVCNLIDRCYNNTTIDEQKVVAENDILQIFILTHNVYFHTIVTGDYEKHNDCVSFFKIIKKSNKSTIQYCVRKNILTNEEENYNPIKSNYAALWQELNEVTTSISACNVIERILRYYFIYLCGYSSKKLKDKLLSPEIAELYVEEIDGVKDYSKYSLIQSFISYLDSNNTIVDCSSYMEDGIEVNDCIEVLKIIFAKLDQIDHYNMMRGLQ